MKKMLITLIMILLNIIILNSKTFRLVNNSNFTLLSKKGNFNDEAGIFAVVKSDKSEKLKKLQTKKIKTHFTKQGVFYINISPLILPGVALGYGRLNHIDNDKRYFETICFLRSHLLGAFPISGIGILVNTFNNSERKGFYYFTEGGFDYVYEFTDVLSPLNPGGSTPYTVHKILFPNFALGAGYSLKIGKISFLRISLDVGVKYLLANINISYVF